MREGLAGSFLVLLTACGGGHDSGRSQVGNGADGAGSRCR